jgi:hypothetical protein
MKVPKRFLKETPGVFKVVGLSFKPQMTSTQTEEKLSIGFKIGDWDDPINFIPYFKTTDQHSPHVH